MKWFMVVVLACATFLCGYWWGVIDSAHTVAIMIDEERGNAHDVIKVLETKYNERLQENKKVVSNLETANAKIATLQGELDEIHNSLSADDLGEWHTIDGVITAYSPLDDRNGINSDGEGEHTSIGLKAGYGIFAVDPKRIPYGSKIVIVYSDGSIEEGIAGDTGGAMRGDSRMHIDVFRQYYSQAMDFGTKQATILWTTGGGK